MATEQPMPRIFEFRTYDLHPGKLDAFKRRFSEHSTRLFARHGITLHGFFEIGQIPDGAVEEISGGGIVLPIVDAQFGQDRVAYIVSFDNPQQRDDAWRSFVADPEWEALRAASEVDGPLVAGESTVVLTPDPVSPMQ
jgi:hypothetical protein